MKAVTPFKVMERLAQFLLGELWSAGLGGASRVRRALVTAVRVGFITIEGFLRDLCLLRASALTFASLLALVPVLAVAFAILRGLGWHGERLEALILSKATVLSAEAIKTIVSYIDNTGFAGLGVVGASLLFLTFLSVMTNIEASFNAIWGHVPSRTLLRRASNYFAVMVTAPILLALATSLTAALQSSAAVAWIERVSGLGTLLESLLAYGAYALVWFLFAFVYLFVPNTRVRIFPAVAAGILAGTVWELSQWAYIRFQVGMANYNAIYGALAQLPVLMAWVYLSWVILLFGAEVSYAVQNVDKYSRERRMPRLTQALREYAGLGIVAVVAESAEGQALAPTTEELAQRLDVPARIVDTLVTELVDAGIVHRSDEWPSRCFLSLAPARISVARVVDVLRGGPLVASGQAVASRQAVASGPPVVGASPVATQQDAAGGATLATEPPVAAAPLGVGPLLERLAVARAQVLATMSLEDLSSRRPWGQSR